MTRQLILDLDTGIDDALALAYALADERAHLLGVTGTYGNVVVDEGVRNSLALTELLGAPDVPVVAGPGHALARDGFEVAEISAFIHGRNGIGDVDIPDAQRGREEGSAVDFLIDAVKTYGEDLVYVPTGPMTTVACALRRAPEIAEKIGAIVCMGGALTVRGNVTPYSEANISQDPEAAHILFTSGAPVTMIGLDVTLQTLLTKEHTRRWREAGTDRARALADMTDYYIRAYETTAPKLGGCGLHDPLAVAVALDPSLVTTIDVPLAVDCEGVTRGRTIGDPDRLAETGGRVKVAVGVDKERFVADFNDHIERIVAEGRAV